MSTHVLQTKFWYVVVAIVAVMVLAFVAVEVAGRPRELKLRVAGMHCEGCAANVTKALEQIPGVQHCDVKFIETPAPTSTGSGYTAKAKAPEAPKIGVATITVAGLNNPSEKELQDAVHLAGDQISVSIEK